MRKTAHLLGYIYKNLRYKTNHESHTGTDLLYFLVGGRWNNVALIAREAVRELLQDLGVSFRGGLMMTLNDGLNFLITFIRNHRIMGICLSFSSSDT